MIEFLKTVGVTRDSALFLWSRIVSLAVLIATGVLPLDQIGLPLTDAQKHTVMVVAGLIAYLSGKLATSPLPGRGDAQKIDPAKLSGVGVVLLAAVLGASISCASMPAKQRAVVSLQSVESALGAAQDFERANYVALGENVPASAALRKLCPPSALPAQLPANATVHQVVSCLFVQAFNSQMASAQALQTWSAGTAPPTFLGELRGEVDAIFGIVKGLSQNTNQQQFLTLTQNTVDSVLSVVQLVGGNVPSVPPGGVQ